VLRIICVRWGTQYSNVDVIKLQKQIKCSVPYTFECITENLETFTPYHNKHYRGGNTPPWPREVWHNGYHRDDFGGIPHHRKLNLFKLDNRFSKSDKILYLDLDAILHGDLAYFDTISLNKPYIVKNYWWEREIDHKKLFHIGRCPLFNSSVMLWKPGQNRTIWNYTKTHADNIFFTYPSMDTFLYNRFPNHFNFFKEGVCQSRRIQKVDKNCIIEMLEGIPK